MRALALSASFCVVLLAALPSGAAAQQELRIDRFFPPATTTDGLMLPDASTIGHLQPAFGLVVDYAYQPLVARSTASNYTAAIVSHRVLMNLMAALGVLEFLEFHLRIPIVFQDGDQPTLASVTFADPDPASISDPAIGGSVRFFGEPGDVFRLGALVEAFIPIAGANSYASEQEFSMRGMLLGDITVSALTVEILAGVHYRPERLLTNAAYRSASELDIGLGARFAAFGRNGDIGLEFLLSTGLRDDLIFATSGTALETVLGGRYRLDMGLAFEVGLGIGFLRSPGTPAVRAFLGIRFDSPAPPPPDADGDTFLDTEDACPTEAEDVDRFQDEDGCPDPDNDADGVLDGDDGCVREAEDVDGYADTDGCPDLDDDEDGIVDTEDSCPRAPGDLRHEGCPATLRIRGSDIELTRNIDFAAGAPTVAPTSGQVLDELAAVMILDDSGVHWRILVRPASARRGDPEMARQRAEAVVRSLVARGVDAARLESDISDPRDDLPVTIVTIPADGGASDEASP